MEDNSPFESDIFSFMRVIYDEAELVTMENAIAIPDDGRSYQAIAQAFLDEYEGVGLKVTPGSSFARTYVKNTEVTVEDMPETWFPSDITAAGYEHFAFSYSPIFVPETERARDMNMAGNTDLYHGDDPAVPQGALQRWMRGSMYLKDGYWYCGGIGTG